MPRPCAAVLAAAAAAAAATAPRLAAAAAPPPIGPNEAVIFEDLFNGPGINMSVCECSTCGGAIPAQCRPT